MKLCSACLLGVKCRYDGNSKPDDKVLALAKKETLIPICPEQLGGLPTPRIPQEQRGDYVFNKEGIDVTKQFRRGAEETLRIAKLFNIREAIFKQKSPSCGCGKVYDGTFSDKIIKGDGVTTALLKKNGIRVITEEDLQ
ncbi:MAG TPA: DUF523 domain-containing protein [Candidatus Nanoarchaeia archaeon]|nr:DUF523 domain-containing protein [Candidatus Nanoarchaeia archaeon]